MTDLAERPKGNSPEHAPTNTDEFIIERGLMAMAQFNGNTRKAAKFMKEVGTPRSHQTLWKWARRDHVERYEAIRAEILPKIRAQAADEHMGLAELQMKANRKIVSRLIKNVDELDTKDLPGASRNMSVGAAVETEKAQLLNDQPTERRAIDMAGTLKELKTLGIEFIDAEVVSEEDVTPAVGSGNGS